MLVLQSDTAFREKKYESYELLLCYDNSVILNH